MQNVGDSPVDSSARNAVQNLRLILKSDNFDELNCHLMTAVCNTRLFPNSKTSQTDKMFCCRASNLVCDLTSLWYGRTYCVFKTCENGVGIPSAWLRFCAAWAEISETKFFFPVTIAIPMVHVRMHVPFLHWITLDRWDDGEFWRNSHTELRISVEGRMHDMKHSGPFPTGRKSKIHRVWRQREKEFQVGRGSSLFTRKGNPFPPWKQWEYCSSFVC